MGRGKATDNAISKKASVVGALTFRYHNALLSNIDPGKIGGAHLPPIIHKTLMDESSYQSFVINLDGQAVALYLVRPFIVVGVLGGAAKEYEQEGEAEAGGPGGEEVVARASKLRILEFKALGMAEHLVEELKELEFPEGYSMT